MQTDEVVVIGFRNVAQRDDLVIDKSHIGMTAHRAPECGNGYNEYDSHDTKEYVFLFQFFHVQKNFSISIESPTVKVVPSVTGELA